MLHRALLQKIRQSHSVDEVSALRWRANELASPQEIAASGEVRIYSKNAWEKFGINDLKAQINEAILISYDEKQFKQICFSLIRMNGGKVLDFPQVATNFFDFEARVLNKHLHILLNDHYPFMAFAFDVEYGKLNFYSKI